VETARPPAREQIPQLLHALNQPLSLLRCSLETILASPRDSEEYRESLRESLRLAEEISAWASGIRELLDAEAECAKPECVRLDVLIREAAEDLRGVANSLGQKFVLLQPDPITVSGNARQLSKAIFYILEYAIDCMCPGSIEILTTSSEDAIHLTVKGSSMARSVEIEHGSFKPDLPPRLGFRIARGIFALVGGTLDSFHEKDSLFLRAKIDQGQARRNFPISKVSP
jgi:hypothetical protein